MTTEAPWDEAEELSEAPAVTSDWKDNPQPGVSGVTATGKNYEHINLPERFREYLTELAQGTGPVAIDFETTDLRPRFAVLVGIAVSESDSRGVYISGELGIDLPAALGAIIAACEDRELLAYNATYELSIAAEVLGQRPDLFRLDVVGDATLLPASTLGRIASGIENDESAGCMEPHHTRSDRERLERRVLNLFDFHDPMLMARLLGYDHMLGLKDQAMEQFGAHMTDITALIGKGASQISMAEVDPALSAPYAADDVVFTWRLFPLFYEDMPDSVAQVYELIERPLLPVSAAMGLSGLDLDPEAVEAARYAVTKRITALEAEIETEFQSAIKSGHIRLELEDMTTPTMEKKGQKRERVVFYGPKGGRIGPPKSTSFPRSKDWVYNPGSNKQAPAFLGTPDAQASTYELSGDPLCLKHRDLDHYRKLLSSYINPVQRMVEDGGRAYFSLNQAGTGTGRYSANGWKIKGKAWSINAQTKPKPKANEDRNDKNSESKLVGRQFRADPPGRGCCGREELHSHVLVEADYSQIELRVAAFIANEPAMIEAYANGRDLHDEMMKRSGLTDRRIAKILNFGCCYEDNDWVACGVVKVAAAQQDLILDHEQCMEGVQFFRTAWPGLKTYYARIDARIKEYGWVETAFGRRLYRRYLPYPYAKPKWEPEPVEQEFDEPEEYQAALYRWRRWVAWKEVDKVNAARRREAINMPVQGTAAEILKSALIMLWDSLPIWATIKLTVHDSIIFQCPEDMVKPLLDWAIPKMESRTIIDMPVPLKAEAEFGPNWADMEELEAA